MSLVSSFFGTRCRCIFFNKAKSCAYWLVNEAIWYETETRPRHLIFSPRRDRDQDLPTFPRDRDETEMFGNYVSRPSRDRDVEIETTSLQVLLKRAHVRPHLIHRSLDPQESAPKRHLDRFS